MQIIIIKEGIIKLVIATLILKNKAKDIADRLNYL